MLGSLGKKAKQKEQWHWMHVFIGLYLWKLDEIILLFHLTHVFFGAKRFVTGLLHSYLSFFSECFFCPKIPWGIGFCKVEWKFLGMRETCNRNARMTCLWNLIWNFWSSASQSQSQWGFVHPVLPLFDLFAMKFGIMYDYYVFVASYAEYPAKSTVLQPAEHCLLPVTAILLPWPVT